LHTDIKSLRTTQDEFHTLLSSPSLRSIAVVLSAAESLAKSDRPSEALEWIAQWLRDLMLVTIGAQSDLLLNTERLTELKDIARSVRLDALLDLLAEIERIQRASTRNINLQLALETLFLQLRDAVHPSAAPAPSH
jgi:DNA polymerase III subunit delta'